MRHIIFSTPQTLQIRYPIFPEKGRRLNKQIGYSSSIVSSRKSDFQDFQGYAKPRRLLPATEVNVSTEALQENISTYLRSGESRSLYRIRLLTSNIYGSGLSDSNAGILLCLIDENGDSILQRVPASSTEGHPTQSDDMINSNVAHFQRGSIDEFTFEGSSLEKIEALWVGLESGQWRLGGISLTVISGYQPPLGETDEREVWYNGLHYEFELDDILLGEDSLISMVELRPATINELPEVDPFSLMSKNVSESSNSLGSVAVSNEESMREYANLKFSLLLYDASLVFFGTSFASLSAGEKESLAFFIGGVVGFLYLLLLQRSVDGLPAPELMSPKRVGKSNWKFGGSKISISSLALAVGFSVLAVKFSTGDAFMVLTPKELMVGMMGFLVCKVAVVLAAFRPLQFGIKDNRW